MATLRMIKVSEVTVQRHPNVLQLTDQQIGQLCGLVEDTTAWVIRSPVIIVPCGQIAVLIANPFSHWLMNMNSDNEYPVVELSSAEATERRIASIQNIDKVSTMQLLRSSDIENNRSRPTIAKLRRLAKRQFCVLCELGLAGRKRKLVPLKIPKDWSSLLRHQLPGTLLCLRCGFKITIPSQDIKRFIEEDKPTSAIIRIKYDHSGEPEVCDVCAAKNQEGRRIERMDGDKVVAQYCSNLLKDPATCSQHFVLINGEKVTVL